VIFHYITVTILIESQQPAQAILNQLLSALTLLNSPHAFRIFAVVRGYYATLGCQSQIIVRTFGLTLAYALVRLLASLANKQDA
jgi:hypothetical protein